MRLENILLVALVKPYFSSDFFCRNQLTVSVLMMLQANVVRV
jgi:hypothetical protein